ncbi:olfactory receptor 11H6-like [Dendropsophus ebraccatus]|uniref:olfactory receptor 11H6-like n=1 Tax=Dendropsophus ebraccatus TaxID=150705 RepID=UPI0038312F76
MTLIGCIIQFCMFLTAEFSESFLLSVMSYDRYVAICNPLHYPSIMTYRFCVTSVNVIWLVASLVMSVYAILIYNLYFCGPHIIDHFYCDLEPILQLSCSDISTIHRQNLITGFFTGFCPFSVIVMSYVYIVITILKIPSNTGRRKAFSTCSSHLTVVSILFGTLMTVYMSPTSGRSLILNKFLSVIYTVLTPLLNPIIYTLRNKDFKEAFRKI